MGGECDEQPDQTSVRLRDRATRLSQAGQREPVDACSLEWPCGVASNSRSAVQNGRPFGGGKCKANDLERGREIDAELPVTPIILIFWNNDEPWYHSTEVNRQRATVDTHEGKLRCHNRQSCPSCHAGGSGSCNVLCSSCVSCG